MRRVTPVDAQMTENSVEDPPVNVIRDPLIVIKEKLEVLRRMEGKSADFTLKSSIRHFKWATVYEGTETDSKGVKKNFSIKKFDSIVLRDPYFSRHILREMRILDHFKVHPNVVALESIGSFREPEGCLLLVTGLLDLTLEDIFRSNHQLEEQQMTCIVYQILFALSYIHKCGVIHRDIQPANVLLNAKCDAKITNFGYARAIGGGQLSEYAYNKFYRAPELVLDSVVYDSKVDLWSAGCIIAQMYNKKQGPKGGPYLPIFTGTTHPEQLEVIIKVTGTPSEEDISSSGTRDSQDYLRRSHRHIPPKDLSKTLHQPDGSKAPRAVIKLIERILMFNPGKRCSADEALQSKWLAVHFSPSDILIKANPFTETNEANPQNIIHKVAEDIEAGLIKFYDQTTT